MSKLPSRISSARRNAEALLGKAQKRDADFKIEQEREREAMALKTARLRELRLAREAEDRKTAPPARLAVRPPKPRRSRQT
jgi:hypothetical protein